VDISQGEASERSLRAGSLLGLCYVLSKVLSLEVLDLEVLDLKEAAFFPTQSHEAMSALLISPPY
jgi:hypothetical protein